MGRVNKDKLATSLGHRVRLQPPARGPADRVFDDDWCIKDVTKAFIEIENLRTSDTAKVGLDAIYTYFTDPSRTTAAHSYGFLQLHAQVRISPDGAITVTPLPPPRASATPSAELNPLVVPDGSDERHFSWRGRDPVHLLLEQDPVQLMEFQDALRSVLRLETAREPEFQEASRIQGEIVYELSADHRGRCRLLGGMGGKPGTAVLVLTYRPAKEIAGDAAFLATCEKGHRQRLRFSKNELRELLAKDELQLYCYQCDVARKPTPPERRNLKKLLA